MNINQIIDMILKRLMGKAINSGINAGINAVSKGGKGNRNAGGKGRQPMMDDPDDMQMPQSGPDKDLARKARQAARMARRVGKF